MALCATWAKPARHEFVLAIGGVHPWLTPLAGFSGDAAGVNAGEPL
jgi:hypothetical protein